MEKIVWSSDGEDFNCDDMLELIDYLPDDVEKAGDVFMVFSGEASRLMVGEFTPKIHHFIEQMQEIGYDFGGEHAESWLNDVDDDQTRELEVYLKSAVNAWADRHGLQPNFYHVENIKEHNVVLTEGDELAFVDAPQMDGNK